MLSKILTRDFDLSDVLTATTRRLISSRHMKGTSDIVGYVTGNPDVTTIDIGMVLKSVQEVVLQQHPQLTGVDLPDMSSIPDAKKANFVKKWVAEQKKIFGDTLPIRPNEIALSISPEEQADHARHRNPNARISSIEVNDQSPRIGKPPTKGWTKDD